MTYLLYLDAVVGVCSQNKPQLIRPRELWCHMLSIHTQGLAMCVV
jgi:hypothetical protein